MKKIIIITECGHRFKTGYSVESMRGATMDCRACGALLIFPDDITGTCVRAEDFHKHLHRQGPWTIDGEEMQWPVDGAGTGYVEF